MDVGELGMRRENRLVQRLEGRGHILSGQRRLAEVVYALDVFQEFMCLTTANGTLELPGGQDVRGRVDLVAGSKDLLFGTSDLWLYLEDGSRLQVLCVPDVRGSACDLISRGPLIWPEDERAEAW
jgi:hypothetical protein